jgi:hypothetical protein
MSQVKRGYVVDGEDGGEETDEGEDEEEGVGGRELLHDLFSDHRGVHIRQAGRDHADAGGPGVGPIVDGGHRKEEIGEHDGHHRR